ncbi:MAG: DUF6263 family protein [Phycisphaerales bacterium]
MTRMKRLIRLAFVCQALPTVVAFLYLTIVPHASAQDAQTYDLRPQWEAGQTARYEIWTSRTQHSVVSLADQKRTTDMNMVSEGEVTWTVDRVKPDGSAECTMTLDWLTLDYSANGKTLKNDSRKGSGEIESIQALLKAMAGVPLKVSVAADGTITKVDGMKTMAGKLGADQKDLVPEELDFIETASDLATLVAAPESIGVGKKWDTKLKWTWSDQPFEGFMHHDMSYTLTGVEDLAGLPVAMVEGKSRLKLELDRSALPDGMPPADVKLVKGELLTQVMFDLSRHEAVGRNSVQTTTVDFTIKMPNATISRRLEETLRGQALRIEEK